MYIVISFTTQDGKQRLKDVISASVLRNNAYMTSVVGTECENEGGGELLKVSYIPHPDFLSDAKLNLLLKFQNIMISVAIICKV